MELHGRHLHCPNDIGWMSHAELIGVPVETREMHPDGLDPGRRSVRQSLLMHLLAIDSIGKAVQHARPVVEGVDDAVGD